MTPRISPPLTIGLKDPDADRLARNHGEILAAILRLPIVGLHIVSDVELADGIDTPIAHGLGRSPLWVRGSSPRGAVAAGYVTEVQSASFDRSRFVVLRAVGYGAPITMDVLVI